jgi:hypothetical protein
VVAKFCRRHRFPLKTQLKLFRDQKLFFAAFLSDVGIGTFLIAQKLSPEFRSCNKVK